MMPLHIEQNKNNDTTTMHVLVIEDDAEDRKLVNDDLSKASPEIFSLEFAERLSAGLVKLSERAADAVLLDLFLPDSEGLETFIQVHAHSPRVPTVILTGLDDEELAMRAVRHGAQDYLRKEHLSSEVLVRTLRYAVERQRAEEQLRQAQKIEVIGRLAEGVAHDFKNLLQVIVGNSEILQDCALRGEVAPQAVERISRAARSATSLTGQLLAFSQRQTLRPLVVDPNEVVAQVREVLRHLIHESIALVFQTETEVGQICIDPGQLQEILLNLAVNARDAMPPGGTLTIETKNVDLPEGYSAKGYRVEPGPYVMLGVRDTGIGMDAQTRAQIFEPFFTTKPNRAGVGLATVYNVVRQCAGHIAVDSAPGSGTTIRVFLPRVKDKAESHRSTGSSGARRCWETILLVEDNLDLREVARGFLVGMGYTVLDAGSVEDALAVARDHPGSIHLLLTDVVLPSGGGQELAARLTSHRPEISVLYMSGHTDDVVAERGHLDPNISVLQKPFSKNQLVRFVREALDAAWSKAAQASA